MVVRGNTQVEGISQEHNGGKYRVQKTSDNSVKVEH